MKISVIGKVGAGKSIFLAQLYARLELRGNTFKISNPRPTNCRYLTEIIDELDLGRLPARTQAGAEPLMFMIAYEPNLQRIGNDDRLPTQPDSLEYPDVSGEYFLHLGLGRPDLEATDVVIGHCRDADCWVLFIPFGDLWKQGTDIVNRYHAHLHAHGIEPQVKHIDDDALQQDLDGSQCFYISLLQRLWFHREYDLSGPRADHRLRVVISHWDEGDGAMPSPKELLQARMPLLYRHLQNCWAPEDIQVIGLSALGDRGRALRKGTTLPDYAHLTEAYFIAPDGTRENDLTKILQFFNHR